MDAIIKAILGDWKQVAGITSPIFYTVHYKEHTITIYTLDKLKLMGYNNSLLEKYSNKIKSFWDSFDKVIPVEVSSWLY